MRGHMVSSWRLTIQHMYIIIALFLYELLWGFFIYRTIESIVVPLLRRFPDTLGIDNAVPLFLAEAQFRIMKTDLITPYLWLFGGLLAARMLLTPFINAGLIYSFTHATKDEGTRFLQGIRAAWKPIALLYVIETALTLTPAIWLLPRGFNALLTSESMNELLQLALPWAGGWFAWAVLLHLLFLAMQFGAVSEIGITRSLAKAIRQIIPYLAISVLMWLLGLIASVTVTSASMLLAGLAALIINQGYYLVRTMIKVWTLAAQYDVLHTKDT